MKTKLLTLIFLTSSSVLLAQEPTPSPSESDLSLRRTEPTLRPPEPTVSVPTEHSEPVYPKPGQQMEKEKPKPTSVRKTEPSPSPVAKSTPKTSASEKSASSSTPKPSKSATKKTGAAAVRELENQWAAAVSKHDVTAIKDLVAGDYIGVTASGKILSKAALLSELRKDKNEYESVKNAQLDVRLHGTTAVVVGTTKQTGKNPAGKPFVVTYRWTDTWMERDDQWACVGSQSIRIP